MRTQQLSSSQSSGSAASAQGIPGALSNQPPAGGTVASDGKTPAAATAGTGSAGGTGSLRKDENIAYEVDKTIQHTRANAGGIKRLTAAIVVNHRRQVDKDGKATTAPLSEKDMGEINALVREAMGYSKERGDSINIVNTAFNEPEKVAVAETPFYKQPDNIQMAKDAGKYLLFALLIGYLYFGVLKPDAEQGDRVGARTRARPGAAGRRRGRAPRRTAAGPGRRAPGGAPPRARRPRRSSPTSSSHG